MKRIAILQSNYIPWKGYFDIVRASDEFVVFDEAQYTKNDWRNRNRIKMPDGLRWLTIAVRSSGLFGQRIADVEVADGRWAAKHWKSIVQGYRKAPSFAAFAPSLESTYTEAAGLESLSAVNRLFMAWAAAALGIDTPLTSSAMYPGAPALSATERLVAICQQAGATHYLSGPSARAYLDEARFNAAGIVVQYVSYRGYPRYRQLYGEFEHAVSIIDLILNEGAGARSFLSPRLVDG